MRELSVALSIAALLLICGALWITPPQCGRSIVVSISTDKHQFRVPEKGEDPLVDDWREIDVDVVVQNNLPIPVILCRADAYGISPQPYVVRMNQQESRLWSGDVLCAPHGQTNWQYKSLTEQPEADPLCHRNRDPV